MILKTSIENIRRDEKSISPVMDLEIERDEMTVKISLHSADPENYPPREIYIDVRDLLRAVKVFEAASQHERDRLVRR